MDRARIERLEALLAKATPGLWSVHPERAWVSPVLDIETPVCAIRWPADDITEDEAFANAALIAEAINALPALLRLARAVADAPEVSFYEDCNMVGVLGPDEFDEQSLLDGEYLLLRADAADTTAGEGNA